LRYDKILQQWEDEYDEDFDSVDDLDQLLREVAMPYLDAEMDDDFRRICRNEDRGLDNLFDFITPRIAVGRGPWRKEDFRKIREAGITHVFDARGEAQRHGATDWLTLGNGGVTYLWCGFSDDFRHKPIEIFREPIERAVRALEEDPNAKVLAHCAAGMNRGPSVAYGILRAATGMTPEDALAAMRRVRPIACAPYRGDVDEALRTFGLCA
jgi:hypothetical protein